MSYLAQVIAIAGEAEVMDLRSKINDTEKKIKSLDKEVEDYLENNYKKFTGLLQENHLILRAKDLASEINRLENRINNQLKKELDASTEEIENLSSKLQEVDTCSSIVNRLLNIDSMIRAAEDDQNNDQYLEAAQKFKNLKELLVSDEHIKNLKVYDSLSNHVVYLHEKFLSDSLIIWNQFISWTDLDMPDNGRRLILTINNVDTKADIIRVLLYYDYLDYEVRVLSRKLYDCILEPVIKYSTTVDVKSDDGIWTIILDYKQDVALMNSNVCIQVIDNLWSIFDALLESLDAFISEEETFINKVGDLLETSFCKCIMEYCLYRAIPTKKEELASFEEVAERVLSFDQFLKDNGFMKPSNTSIEECVKNVNHLFLSKTCQSYLSDARKIFDQDLHDMVQIKSTLKDELKSNYDTNDPDVTMCKNVLQQPACFISKSTQDLLGLICKALEEIPKSEVSYSVELYFTVRNIISLYCDLMPLKHKVLLKSIPQQSALFYNNCMYLTHELITLDIKSLSILPGTLNVTFVDFVEPLRSLGHSVFNSQIEIQQEQLLKILENSGISNLSEYNEFPPSVEKSTRQCFRQLTLLQSVWHNILPHNMYCKVMGKLCNSFLEKLIESVLHLQDITVDAGGQLTNVFTIVLDKIPALFSDSKEVYRHVKRWSKFNELLRILNGSLKDIDDRWADGKGPLAQDFTPDQVKHLIRALFQHTDRRGALLSKIR